MSPEFREKIKKGYSEDKRWKETIRQLRRLGGIGATGIPYLMDEELIYYIDPVDSRHRLCIPKSLEKEIFQMAHDEHHHAGFHRAYNTIVAGLFIQNLSKQLTQYIIYCP